MKMERSWVTRSNGRGLRSGLNVAQGFSMLEVLVTLVILLIGLLGLAGVMAHATTAEMESYQRVQAIMLAQDMVDRINANRKYIDCYSNGPTGMNLGTGAGAIPACAAGIPA